LAGAPKISACVELLASVPPPEAVLADQAWFSTPRRADQRAVATVQPVQHYAMADRHALAEDQRPPGSVCARTVRSCFPSPMVNRLVVGAQDRARQDADVLAQDDRSR